MSYSSVLVDHSPDVAVVNMTASRHCPVCATPAADAELFAEDSIDPTRLTDLSFASRKQPEYMSHRLVRCRVCDLVFVPDPPEQGKLADAYHDAGYDSSAEADDAAESYLRAIRPVLSRLDPAACALEIGTGTAVFLERLSAAGFTSVHGVEPSSAAIAAAPPHRRAWITEGIFRGADFPAEAFDLVCCFMTLEHVRDPKIVADEVLRLLRPGGAFVTVTHDYRSLVNRLLGSRSPIIDIEHMQLFSVRSIRELYLRCGYEDVSATAFSNRYALQYWTRLLPVPAFVKQLALNAERWLHLADVRVSLNVGNVIAAGHKPRPTA